MNLKALTQVEKGSKARLTPLSIIAIFVGLSETVTGAIVSLSTGLAQLYLTYFVILFPVGVAAVFFLILVFKHWVFYAPSEYPEYVKISDFRGIRPPRPLSESEAYQLLVDQVKKVELDKEKVDKIVKSIQELDLTIDSTPLLDTEGIAWRVPYKQFASIQELLDSIWLALPHNRVRAYSYEKDWILKDAQSGTLFRDIGTRGGKRRDTRSLEQIGIRPGMRLLVISPI